MRECFSRKLNSNTNFRLFVVRIELADKMANYIERGEDLASRGFHEESLNSLRKFWEVVLNELGVRFDCKDDKYQITFGRLRKHVPARLFYYLTHIQSMGNYASHFQEDGVEPSIEDAQYCIFAGKEIYQWMYPDEVEDPIEKSAVFIKNAFEAVPCDTCGRKIGEKCIGISTGIVWENKVHKHREKAYSKYRRNFQKHYDTTIAKAMNEMIADIGLERGVFIEPKEIRVWFADNYPAYTENAVNTHSMMMATNLKTRHSHHESKNGDEKYNLFFGVGRKFRLYDLENDPSPLLFGKPLQ